MAISQVVTNSIADSAVVAADIASGAVTQAKIATGVAGTGPAFSAYQSVAQSISANTFTKITLDTEQFDTNNNFSSSRFTPTVAGYYQINATLTTTTPLGSSIYFNLYITKNGNPITQTTGYPSPVNYYGVTSSTVVYLNGSTDYIEMAGQSNSAYSVQADSKTTYLSGCLVRAA